MPTPAMPSFGYPVDGNRKQLFMDLSIQPTKTDIMYVYVRSMKRLLLILFAVISGQAALAQNVTVKGVVSAGDTSLAAVTVQVKGTNVATQTDVDGSYTISAPAKGTLVFTSVGFAAMEIPVNN